MRNVIRQSEKYGSEYMYDNDGVLLFRPLGTDEEFSEVDDRAFSDTEQDEFYRHIEVLFDDRQVFSLRDRLIELGDEDFVEFEESQTDDEDTLYSTFRERLRDYHAEEFANGGMITEDSNAQIIANVKKEQGQSDLYFALFDVAVAYGERPKIARDEMEKVFDEYDEDIRDYFVSLPELAPADYNGLSIYFDDNRTYKEDIRELLRDKWYMRDNEYLTDYGNSFYVYAQDINPRNVLDVYESIIEKGYDENVELELFEKGGLTDSKRNQLGKDISNVADELRDNATEHLKDSMKFMKYAETLQREAVEHKEQAMELNKIQREADLYERGGKIEIDSVSELYDTYFEKYPAATELVAYYVYDYKDDNDIYNMEIGKYGKPIDITPYSELMLRYEYTWKHKMPELDEQVKELMDNESMETGMFAKGGSVEDELYVAPYFEDRQLRGYTIKDKKNPQGRYTISTNRERAEENRQYLIDNPSRLSYYRKNEYAKGGVIYAVDIDTVSGDEIRGGEFEHKTYEKAKKQYDEIIKKDENKNDIDNIQLLKIQGNNYEVLESMFSYAKGGKTKKFQTRYLLSDYGYRGKIGTEIEVVDISKETELVYGIPKKELTKVQKEMLPFEYEIDDTSVLPVLAKGGRVVSPSGIVYVVRGRDKKGFVIAEEIAYSTKDAEKKSIKMTLEDKGNKIVDIKTEIFKPKNYAKGGRVSKIDRDIRKFKTQLINKAKRKGIYENFGQNEVRKIEEKYDMYERDDMGVPNYKKVQDFSNWAMNYEPQFERGGVVEQIVKMGGEYDLSNMEHSIPNRAIRYNKDNSRYEIFNYMTDEVDYSDRQLEDILTKANRMFDTNF